MVGGWVGGWVESRFRPYRPLLPRGSSLNETPDRQVQEHRDTQNSHLLFFCFALSTCRGRSSSLASLPSCGHLHCACRPRHSWSSSTTISGQPAALRPRCALARATDRVGLAESGPADVIEATQGPPATKQSIWRRVHPTAPRQWAEAAAFTITAFALVAGVVMIALTLRRSTAPQAVEGTASASRALAVAKWATMDYRASRAAPDTSHRVVSNARAVGSALQVAALATAQTTASASLGSQAKDASWTLKASRHVLVTVRRMARAVLVAALAWSGTLATTAPLSCTMGSSPTCLIRGVHGSARRSSASWSARSSRPPGSATSTWGGSSWPPISGPEPYLNYQCWERQGCAACDMTGAGALQTVSVQSCLCLVGGARAHLGLEIHNISFSVGRSCVQEPTPGVCRVCRVRRASQHLGRCVISWISPMILHFCNFPLLVATGL